jgi:flagellar biosynthesis/type III secretory pathway M-ring protein FliF/YscJ
MASLQQTLDGIGRQMRDLTLSQKAAIFMGVLLVAASLLWLGTWAATPDMVPLISQDLPGTDVAEIRSGLDVMRESYKVVGSRVMVPATANRAAILAQLQQLNKMPSDLAVGFAELVKESNPWLSQDESEKRWSYALKIELERVLRQMQGVKDARVFLNISQRDRGFSRAAAESKASVTLFMKNGETVSRGLALAAARQISGAVRGVPLRNVEVLDGAGRSALLWDEETSGGASSLQRIQTQVERDAVDKIARQLDFDRNVRVTAQALLETTAMTEKREEPIEGVETETTNNTTIASRGDKNAPGGGVEANVGASIAGGASGESEKTETDTKKLQPGLVQTTKSNPAGTVKQLSAAILLSHSYLSSVVKRRSTDAKEPSEAEIQKEFDAQKSRIVNLVSKLVVPQEAKQVAVDWYYDVPDAVPLPGTSLDVSMDLAARFGPTAGLAALALGALVLMLRMAKTSNSEAFGVEIGLPKEAIEAAREAATNLNKTIEATGIGSGGGKGGGRSGARGGGIGSGDATEVIPMPMGQVAEGVLEGQEIDEGILATGNMVDQVERMVSQDDDGAAALIEKWVDAPKIED